MDAPRARDARAKEVLGRGLAHRASDAHHEPVGVTGAPLVGKTEQELLCVVVLGAHDGAAALVRKGEQCRIWLARHHDAGSPRLDGGRRKVVAVDLLAEERHKDGARANLARVNLDRAFDARRGRALKQLRPRGEHEVCDVHGKHRFPLT